MKELFGIFAKLSFIFVLIYVVSAGFGQSVSVAPQKKKCGNGGGRWKTRNVKGNMWATSVAQAPLADDGNAYPAAPVM